MGQPLSALVCEELAELHAYSNKLGESCEIELWRFNVNVFGAANRETMGRKDRSWVKLSEEIQRLLANLSADLAALYGKRLRRVYLYGSYARCEARPDSDIDILIVLDAVPSYSAEIERTSQLISSYSLDSDLSISRVFISEQQWTSASSSFVYNVSEDAVEIAVNI